MTIPNPFKSGDLVRCWSAKMTCDGLLEGQVSRVAAVDAESVYIRSRDGTPTPWLQGRFSLFRRPEGAEVNRSPIDLPGKDWVAILYKCNNRPSGRRVIVWEREGPIFDSDECHDSANALNRLDLWLAHYIKEQPT